MCGGVPRGHELGWDGDGTGSARGRATGGGKGSGVKISPTG